MIADPDEWQQLLQAEKSARSRLFRHSSGSPPSDAVRAWWGEAQKLIEGFRARLGGGDFPDPPPLELLAVLDTVAGFLAVGELPEPVADVLSPGRIGTGPLEAREIGWATAYLELTKRGVIFDRSPILTVQKAYDVKRTTVQGWKRRSLPLLVARTMEEDAEVVRENMLAAGASYRVAGRSIAAVKSRGRGAGK